MPQERHVLVSSSHSRASFLFALNIQLAQHPSRTPCHGAKKRPVLRMETSAVSATKPKIVINNQSTRPPHHLSQPYHEVEVCRGREAPEAKVTMGPFFDNRADYLKGTCTRTPCEHWHPPECQFCKSETVCKAGDRCLFPHYKEQPSKKPKKSCFPQSRESDDKNAVVKSESQFGLCITRLRCARLRNTRVSEKPDAGSLEHN